MSWTTAGTSGNAGGGGGGASANAGGSGTAVTSSGVSTPQAQKKSSRAVENDLIVPVVLWNDVPRVKVSCVHVLYLPISQPSQNSSVQANGASGSSQQQQQMQMSISPPPQPPTPSSSSSVMPPRRLSLQDSGVEMRDSEGDGATKDGAECELYQVCVFAGTTDGAVVYWLYEQDQVVRVNLLVPNTAVCAATTTLSTADAPETIEDFSWDQYDPDQRNSPIVGITGGIDEWGQSIMLSVSRAGGVARWQLPNGYCSYTNAELASQLAPIKGIEMFSNNRYALVYSAESRMMVLDIWKMALLYCVDTAQEQIRRSIAVGEIKMNAVRRSGSFPKSLSSLPSSNSSRGPTDGVNDGNNGLNNGPGISGHTGSFGSQSSVNKNSGGSGSAPTPNTPGQVWDSLVISLGTEGLAKCFLWSRPRGGSNTAPGTSSTSSGTFTWMQESCWILSWADDAEDITCSQSTSLRDGDNMNPQTALMRSIKSSYFPIAVHVSPDSSLLLFIWKSKWVVLKRKWLCRTDNGNKTSNKSGSRTKTPVCVGSCRITPATFLGRKEDQRGVWWQGGEFIGDSQVVLWTNTGHVFQFPACGNAMNPAGKLFIFTKDLDQFVPRSNFKSLNAIEKGQYIAFLRQCECCSTGVTQGENGLRKRADRFHAGYTSCVTATGLKSTPLVRLVHVCTQGSFGCWNLSSNGYASPPRMMKSHAFPVQVYDRIKFYSLASGFDLARARGGVDKSISISHVMLARESSRTSSVSDLRIQGNKRRRRRPLDWQDILPSAGSNTQSAAAMASSVLATALGPVTSRQPPQTIRSTTASAALPAAGPIEQMQKRLMDVPVLVRGYRDGSVHVDLLADASESPERPTGVRLVCHKGRVTTIAHCYWPVQCASDLWSSQSTPSRASPGNSHAGVFLSTKKARTWKRGAPIEESCLATDRNPFYRSRFPPITQRRSVSSRHLNISAAAASSSSSIRAENEKHITPNPKAIYFMIFTGGEDGAMKVIEVALLPSESGLKVEAHVLQQFRKHQGPIQEIAVSPSSGDTSARSPYQDRFLASVGKDRKVIIYAPLYNHNPFSRTPSVYNMKNACGLEWECIYEFCEHPDTITGLDWHLENGFCLIECEDRMVHVWSLDTGLLERSVPSALVYEGGNSNADDPACTAKCSTVSWQKVQVGNTSIQLLKYAIMESAEHIKKSWRSYYYSLLAARNDEEESMEESEGKMASPYAIGSIELLMLSFLLSWGATTEVDRTCRDLLGLSPPRVMYSCALMDTSSTALTIPIPWREQTSSFAPMNQFVRNWQYSSAQSANLALGIVSLCMSLMEHRYSKFLGDFSNDGAGAFSPSFPSSPNNKEEFHVLWSQLITQHSVVLPDYVPHFREPSLESLAAYGFHSCDYMQLAARALLNGVIKRLSAVNRSAMTAEYSTKLHCELVRLEMDTGSKLNGAGVGFAIDFHLVVRRLGSLVILLSMIGTCFPGEISPAGAREVCDILVYLLKSPTQSIASVSAELLTKGLMLFRPHLVDLSSLICQLLLIDMREKQRNPDGSSGGYGSNARVLANGGGSAAALSLLVELGACESAFVLNLLQQEMNNAERSHAFRECVLLYLTELINTHYLLMFRHLPAVIDTIMCCLDPTKPERRKRCLELSTRCLHNLVRRFPMVDFHKDTQRLAIGTMEAVILIYDLRTATKWRVLDGHTCAVSAVAFRSDGQIVVSYAAREGSVRWWNSGSAGIFGGMLKMQQSCLKEHKLPILKNDNIAIAPSSSGGASADLKQVIQTCRFQFLTVKDTQAQPGVEPPKEKRILRLTREDASQVQFLL